LMSTLKSIDTKALDNLTKLAFTIDKVTQSLARSSEVAKGGDDNLRKLIDSTIKIIREIRSGADLDLTETGEKSGETYLDGVRRVLKISSPSRAMMAIGKQMMDGLKLGFRPFSDLFKGIE